MYLHDNHLNGDLSDADRREMAQYIWRQESVELNTVGIDIGSSTSHLLFAKITLQRRSQGLSSRFLVTGRDVVWRSPIMLTPFLDDGSIDTARLGQFIHDAYHQAGFARQDIDSGAVILTGEAIKRKNARAIDDLFAEEAGKFVCATAGHKLESTLAAHGSGAVKLSKELGICLLHLDIGGGTTKMALIDHGRIAGVGAFAVGGRLLASDKGNWTRVDEAAQLTADDLGLRMDAKNLDNPEVRRRIAGRLAEVAVDYIQGHPLDRLGMGLQLTELLTRHKAPAALSFSGGVSEYIFERDDRDYGDIAKMLALELRRRLADEGVDLPLLDPGQGIRATVIGASQFTVQVSGKTIYLPDHSVVPLRNVPVVHLDVNLADEIDPHCISEAILAGIARLDLSPESRMALAFTWQGDPEFRRLAAMGEGIIKGVAPQGRREAPLLLMIDGDVGKTLGYLLQKELGLPGRLVAVDGVQLQELDFVDVGELINPPGVLPIVIKSLLFS